LNDAVVRLSENNFVILQDLLNAERQAFGGNVNVLSISEDLLHVTQDEVTILKKSGRFCCSGPFLVTRRHFVVRKLEILFLHISHYEANQYARSADGLRFLLPNSSPNVATESTRNNNEQLSELDSLQSLIRAQTSVLWVYENPQQKDIDDISNQRMKFKTLFQQIPEHQRCQWLERQSLRYPYYEATYRSIAKKFW
jgi:hypothetical protein